MARRLRCAAFAICLCVRALSGQTADRAAPTFEVASVKPNTGAAEPRMDVPSRGPVVVVNVPLHNVITNAFRVPPFHVVGGPDWIRSERFDITAKPPDTTTVDQLPGMLQALLIDRFKLRVHRETREQPIYSLIVARGDGRLGPQLRPSAVDCAALDRERAGPPPAPPSPASPCGGTLGMGAAGGVILLNGRSLSRLASALGMAVNRTVVDRTGLEGGYDLELRWSALSAVNAVNDTPSIFVAVEEQLGLRLVPDRGPVDLLVIDSVERPSPD